MKLLPLAHGEVPYARILGRQDKGRRIIYCSYALIGPCGQDERERTSVRKTVQNSTKIGLPMCNADELGKLRLVQRGNRTNDGFFVRDNQEPRHVTAACHNMLARVSDNGFERRRTRMRRNGVRNHWNNQEQ